MVMVSPLTDVEMLLPPAMVSVSPVPPRLNSIALEESSATLNVAVEIVLSPTPRRGIPPGVTPSEILSVRSPLGSAS